MQQRYQYSLWKMLWNKLLIMSNLLFVKHFKNTRKLILHACCVSWSVYNTQKQTMSFQKYHITIVKDTIRRWKLSNNVSLVIPILTTTNTCVLDGNGGFVSIPCGDPSDTTMPSSTKKSGSSQLIFYVNDSSAANDPDNIKCKYLFFM